MNATADLFKALADSARIRILEFLHRPEVVSCSSENRVCACDVEGILGLSQPTVSHHLKVLVQAGLVEAEKNGRFIYYRINRPRLRGAAQYLAAFGRAPAKTTASSKTSAIAA